MRDPREFLNKTRFTVCFSGGKDSLATLLWILDNVKHTNFNILYIEVTGNTHNICNEYVRKVCNSLGVLDRLIVKRREDLDFFKCIKKWGIPIIGKYRWCLYQFKHKFFVKDTYPVNVLGIKNSDSKIRRRINQIDYVKMSRKITVNPILNWDKWMVLDYIKDHGLEINPCYSIYGHSGNCMFCPYHNKKQIIMTMRDEYWREKIIEALKHVRGRISKEIAERWFRYAFQYTIADFISSDSGGFM